jgi:hypothetical protein
MENRTKTVVILLALVAPCAAARADEPSLFAPPAFNPAAPPVPAREPLKVQSESAGDWGALTGKAVVRDVDSSAAWEDPLAKREWQTDQAWRCPLAGPLFAFGQLGANSTEEAKRDMKVAGKYGLGCKWAPVEGAEFVLRGGPSLTYTDPLRPERTQEKSEWLVEVQARWPLFGPVGLEYQGTAAPALTPLDHDWLTQDVRLAVPVGAAGKFRVGARSRWDDTGNAKPSPDAMQLYLGLELKH